MFKTLLALALTVNLAASLSCISGVRYVYGAGCDDDEKLDSSSFESVDYDGSSYGGCVSYSHDTDYGTGCSFTTITSGPLLPSQGCDYFATVYGSGYYSNFECSDCTTDDCNDEYVSDSSGSTADDDSGGGDDDAEVVIICILGMSGFATADLDDAAVTVVATSVAAVLDGVTAQDIYDIAAADARRRRRLLDITITFEIRLSLADTQFASADDLGASVDSQLNEAVADGSLTSTVQAEAESAGVDALAAASADSVDTEVAPRDKSPAGGGGGKKSHSPMRLMVIVAGGFLTVVFGIAALLYCVCGQKKKDGDTIKLDETNRQVV